MSALGLQTLSSKKRGVIRLRPAFFERFGPRMSEINATHGKILFLTGAAFDFKRVDRLCRVYQTVDISE
jgi:hypothetical protein